MKKNAIDILEQLLKDFAVLEQCREAMEGAFNIMKECYLQKGKLLVCGNGGSASDSEHIVGELMKGFKLKRRICEKDAAKLKNVMPKEWDYFTNTLQGALPAISLVSHSALITAFANDVAPDMIYAQQVYGYGNTNDVLIGLSTSGNSKNVINAIKVAGAFGVKTIGMTGKDGGGMKGLCDVIIMVPSSETYRIQEYHLPVYHTLCAMLEAEFFSAE